MSDARGTAHIDCRGARPPLRLFCWCLLREIWESKSVYIAPLVAAAVVLLGFLVGAHGLPHRMQAALALETARQGAALTKPYDLACAAITLTSLLTGMFYCFGALYNERRDRSILFWKSLPVSDVIAVLAKASIPFIVLPTIGFSVVLATQSVMLLLSTVILTLSGVGAGALWAQIPFLHIWFVFAYSLAVMSLWFAPIYGWVLMVSGWARSKVFLWVVLPPLGLCVAEPLAFGSSQTAHMLGDRVIGFWTRALPGMPPGGDVNDAIAHLDPVGYLCSADLWAGLAVAGACVAISVWLRRNREPL